MLCAMMKDAADGVVYRGRRQPSRQVDVLAVITDALVAVMVPGGSVLASSAGEGGTFSGGKAKAGKGKGKAVAVEEVGT